MFCAFTRTRYQVSVYRTIVSLVSPVTFGAERKITHPMARSASVSKIDLWNIKFRFGDKSKMEGEYVEMLGIIHTCTALRYKPAFIATW